MKRIVTAAVLAAAVVSGSLAASPARAQSWSELRNPQIEIEYVEPRNAAFKPIYERLKKRQVLEELQAFLSPLKLPRNLTVKLDQCGSASSPYKRGGPAVICYEYVRQVEALAPQGLAAIGPYWFETEFAVVGGFVHIMLHQVARAVFDIFEIPVWGRSEYAADKVAAFVMFQFGPETAFESIMGAAWFLAHSSFSGIGDFSIVRSTDVDAQRFYNFVCIALGGDSSLGSDSKFRFTFLKAMLPAARANGCESEFKEIQDGFARTMMPHIDVEQMEKVRKIKWLQAG
jgi:hypothetical protein